MALVNCIGLVQFKGLDGLVYKRDKRFISWLNSLQAGQMVCGGLAYTGQRAYNSAEQIAVQADCNVKWPNKLQAM